MAQEFPSKNDVAILAERNVTLLSAQDKSNYEYIHEEMFGIPTDNYRLFSGMESTCQRIFGL
jgi:hypothetical protein